MSKIIITIFFLVTLSGCFGLDGTEKALEGQLIETESLIDARKFIREGKRRGKKTAKYGPQVVEIEDSGIREKTRVMIDKEEAPNYDELKDNGNGNIFPVFLNVDNVEIRTFTQMMSKITGINFLVSDEVTGNVTAKLQNVMWPNALDSVLNLKGLAKHVDNDANIIRIHSQSVIVSLESFERQRKADLQQTALLSRANEPLYTEIFKLFYTEPSEVKTLLESVLGVSAAAESKGRNTQAQITVDERANQLIIKARKDDLNLVSKLIDNIDSRTKQVFIEAFIVEVTDDFEKALGTRLGIDISANNESITDKALNARATGLIGTTGTDVGPGNNAGLTDFAVAGATSGIAGLFGTGDVADLKVALTALEADNVSKVISNPRVFTLDNQEATIFQGSQIPYTTTSADGTQVEFQDAGLKLSVTPTVVGDGNLMLQINLNKDTADISQALPPITSSEINTNLVTKDGSIVAIGGIYTQTKTDSSDKTPFLGDVPGLGKLFRRDTRLDDKQELMIFIAPRII